MAHINTLGAFVLVALYSQYPIPNMATILNNVNAIFAVLSFTPGIKSLILVPHAMPSFSIKKILNQLKTSILSCNLKCVFIYILLIWSISKTMAISRIDFFKVMYGFTNYDS